MTRVHSSADPVEARLLRRILEAEGLPIRRPGDDLALRRGESALQEVEPGLAVFGDGSRSRLPETPAGPCAGGSRGGTRG